MRDKRLGQSFLWTALIVVLCAMILAILGITAFGPQPERLSMEPGAVPPVQDTNSAAALLPPDNESAAVKCTIDSITALGKYYKLAGWAYVEKQETAKQQVFVQLRKPDGSLEHYTTRSSERHDVGRKFNNPLYNNAGFIAIICMKEGLDIQTCSIRVVVVNQSGRYKSRVCRAPLRAAVAATRASSPSHPDENRQASGDMQENDSQDELHESIEEADKEYRRLNQEKNGNQHMTPYYKRGRRRMHNMVQPSIVDERGETQEQMADKEIIENRGEENLSPETSTTQPRVRHKKKRRRAHPGTGSQY